MKYIDIHCHLNFPDYAEDREAVIRRAADAEVGMIIVGTHRETSTLAVELAEKHENVWAIVGLHPIYAHKEKFDNDFYLKLAQHPKVVGIGECGFDYFRTDGTADDWSAQQEAFLGQIEIANKVKKPLMLHLRNGKESVAGTIAKKSDAYGDALSMLKSHAKVIGDVHFFAGTLDEAQAFLDLGFYISFTGVVTFARNYDAVIRQIPLDRIMSETDAPYVTPIPHRGKRNEPYFVTEVANAIASIRGEAPEKVLPQLVENARRLFSI